jgi:CheY-like chemotaxis protein
VSTAGAHQTHPPRNARPVVVLAVDDHERRAAYAYALTASGFDVVAPNDPIAWCVNAFHARPDLIVAAVGERDDWMFVRQFKQHARTRDIPLVALAADVGAATRERAHRERCAAICVQTCAAHVLARGLRAVLHQTDPADVDSRM